MKRSLGNYSTLALVFFAAMTFVAAAQQSIRTLRTGEVRDATLLLGETVEIVGKYRELIDDRLYLVDCPIPFVLETPALFRQLVQFTAKKSNLSVRGAIGNKAGVLVIITEAICEANGDQELYESELNELSKEHSQESRDKAYELGWRIVKAKQMQKDESLLPLVVAAFRFALECDAGVETLTTDAMQRRTKRILAVHETLKDDSLARNLLVSLLDHAPDKTPVQDSLAQLNCRRYLGRWVTYREFKTKEGLVEYDGKWITTRDKHFSETMEKFANHDTSNLLLLRRRTEKEYLLTAERGNVEVGMNRQEVCLAFGFPDYVLRSSCQRKEFDQWEYGSKYYYFFDGILVHAGR